MAVSERDTQAIALQRAREHGIEVPWGATAIPLYRRGGAISGYTLVDTADAAWVNQWRWSAMAPNGGRIYVQRHGAPAIGGHYPQRLLHRELLGLPPYRDGREGDHINLNTLDNRRANLRVVNRAMNAQNVPARGGTSPHRGVCWHRRERKWHATATVNGQRYYLGSFTTEAEAHAVVSAWRAQHMPGSIEALARAAGVSA